MLSTQSSTNSTLVSIYTLVNSSIVVRIIITCGTGVSTWFCHRSFLLFIFFCRLSNNWTISFTISITPLNGKTHYMYPPPLFYCYYYTILFYSSTFHKYFHTVCLGFSFVVLCSKSFDSESVEWLALDCACLGRQGSITNNVTLDRVSFVIWTAPVWRLFGVVTKGIKAVCRHRRKQTDAVEWFRGYLNSFWEGGFVIFHRNVLRFAFVFVT